MKKTKTTKVLKLIRWQTKHSFATTTGPSSWHILDSSGGRTHCRKRCGRTSPEFKTVRAVSELRPEDGEFCSMCKVSGKI